MASWFRKNRKAPVPNTEPLSGPGTIPPYSSNPTLAWDREKVRQKVEKVQPKDWKSTKPENHTRFVCISGMLASYINSSALYHLRLAHSCNYKLKAKAEDSVLVLDIR